MAPPWAETPTKVVIEFQKSGGNHGRTIRLQHAAKVLPDQLYGRLQPEVWHNFMVEVERLAQTHPYVTRPSAATCANWAASFACIICVGFGCVNPDGGDYGPWLAQLQALVDAHRPIFASGGAFLSVQSVHSNFWVQVDVDPMLVAVGQPVPKV